MPAVTHAAQTTPEIAADVLATAVDKAVKLERERSDRETRLAVEKATREAEVNHRMDDHELRLSAINGSISRNAGALVDLKKSVDDFHEKQEKRNEKWDTEQAVHWKKAGQAFSKRQMVLAWVAVLATAGGGTIAEVLKGVFGG